MTRDEFKQLLIELNPANKATIEHSAMPLPVIATMTAAYCFIREDNGVNAFHLRKQLLSLEKKGVFDFEGE